MIPEREFDLTDLEVVEQPSLTYKLDFENGRIGRKIDGERAIMQAVRKILNTERYANVIYSSQYGVELERLIGENYNYIVSDLERTIEEALMADDRIMGIEDFEIEQISMNALSASFTVNSIMGAMDVDTEVQIL